MPKPPTETVRRPPSFTSASPASDLYSRDHLPSRHSASPASATQQLDRAELDRAELLRNFTNACPFHHASSLLGSGTIWLMSAARSEMPEYVKR